MEILSLLCPVSSLSHPIYHPEGARGHPFDSVVTQVSLLCSPALLFPPYAYYTWGDLMAFFHTHREIMYLCV